MFETINSTTLAGVSGGQVPGQIDQPQAVGAGIQGARTGAAVGQTVGSATGAALAPLGLQNAGAAVGGSVGRVGGAVIGGGVGYVQNVGSQIRNWFR